MALTKSLPLELVDMILGWARLDPKTLVACSYVCKAWKARSQAMLLRDVPISLNRHQLSSLDGVLSQSPELGLHIRSFGIEVKGSPLQWRYRRFRHMFGYFIAILTHSPNLVRLTVNVGYEFDSTHAFKLTSINLRHIHTLNWRSQSTSSVLYSLLALWPSIRYLRINNLQLNPPQEHQRPALLRSLFLCRRFPENFMTWLVPTGDEEPLRELHLEGNYPGTSQVLKGVLLHAPTLHVLAVNDFPPQSLLDALTALNELAFRALPSAPVRLPLSVQRVKYRSRERPRPHCMTLDREWDNEADSESLKKTSHLITALMDLPKLTLVGVTFPTAKEVMVILEKFCREKMVEFDVCDNSALYSPWYDLI